MRQVASANSFSPAKAVSNADVPVNMDAPRVAQGGRQVKQNREGICEIQRHRRFIPHPPLPWQGDAALQRTDVFALPAFADQHAFHARQADCADVGEGRAAEGAVQEERRGDALPCKVRQQEDQQRGGDHAAGNAEGDLVLAPGTPASRSNHERPPTCPPRSEIPGQSIHGPRLIDGAGRGARDSAHRNRQATASAVAARSKASPKPNVPDTIRDPRLPFRSTPTRRTPSPRSCASSIALRFRPPP